MVVGGLLERDEKFGSLPQILSKNPILLLYLILNFTLEDIEDRRLEEMERKKLHDGINLTTGLTGKVSLKLHV